MQLLNIDFHERDSVGVITLNQPNSGNSLSYDRMKDLLAAVDQCREQDAVRAVLIRSSGSIFCAGADLDELLEHQHDLSGRLRDMATIFHCAVERLYSMEKPVVVSVDGACYGGGLGLVLAGDIVIAGHGAKFSTAYTGLGLSPDGGCTYHLPRRIGELRARELILTNRVLYAEEAEKFGLVSRVVVSPNVQSESWTIASVLAKGPTKAFGLVKSLLLEGQANTLANHLDKERECLANSGNTQDAREGLSSYLESRVPIYLGR